MIFRLFEYKFVDENDYSSIKLVKTKNYSLQDTTIEVEDLIEVRNNTPIFYKDNQYEDLKVPFIQANSFERVISLREDKQKKVFLTKLGEKVFSLNYKQRQLKFVELILQHQIFADCFDMVIGNGGEMIDKKVIENMMREYNVCNEGQIVRRASSVQGWLKWIFNLRNL